MDFTYHIIPTEDFIEAVLLQGDRLEAIASEEICCMVKIRLEKAYNLYVEI